MIAVSCCRSRRWWTWVFSGLDAYTVSKTGAREGVWVRAERSQLVSAVAGQLVSREPTEDRRRRPEVYPTGSA